MIRAVALVLAVLCAAAMWEFWVGPVPFLGLSPREQMTATLLFALGCLILLAGLRYKGWMGRRLLSGPGAAPTPLSWRDRLIGRQ